MVSDEEIKKVMRTAGSLSRKSRADYNNFRAQHLEVFEEQNRRNKTASAIRKNDLDSLKKYIAENRDYVSKLFVGKPLIYIAAQAGNLEACKILIAAGADINQLTDTNNSTLAIVKLSFPLIEYLLNAGADPNNRSVFNVFTMYQNVSEESRLEIVKLLVSNGMEINRVYLMFNDPNSMQTALDFIGNSYPSIRDYLIGKGAKHASDLENPGAYDSANAYLSFEQLEDLRQRMEAKSKQRGKS